MDYSEKLKDPRWQKKRLKILERDEWMCSRCGDDKKTLHVHHLEYNGEPWETKDKNLETLCEDCHRFEHDFEQWIDDSIEILLECGWNKNQIAYPIYLAIKGQVHIGKKETGNLFELTSDLIDLHHKEGESEINQFKELLNFE